MKIHALRLQCIVTNTYRRWYLSLLRCSRLPIVCWMVQKQRDDPRVVKRCRSISCSATFANTIFTMRFISTILERYGLVSLHKTICGTTNSSSPFVTSTQNDTERFTSPIDHYENISNQHQTIFRTLI